MRQRKKARFYESQGSKEYGLCVLCGDRVYNHHEFIAAEEGYCHKSCIPEA